MPSDDLAMRRRRALYRATHRGSKELDFLLGRFAEQEVERMTIAEIGILERLIEAPDPDIAVSLFDGQSLGEADLDDLMRRLRRFHGLRPSPLLSRGPHDPGPGGGPSPAGKERLLVHAAAGGTEQRYWPWSSPPGPSTVRSPRT